MAQQASPYVAKLVYGLIAVSVFFAFLVLSRSAAFHVSGSIAVCAFTHLRSYWGQQQIVAMERKELMTMNEFLILIKVILLIMYINFESIQCNFDSYVCLPLYIIE